MLGELEKKQCAKQSFSIKTEREREQRKKEDKKNDS
jgi:hypothetical protein